jgi:hypothetical protein
MKKNPLYNKDKKDIRGDIKASNRVGIFASLLGGLLATNLSVLVIELIALFVVLFIIYLTKLSTRKKEKNYCWVIN